MTANQTVHSQSHKPNMSDAAISKQDFNLFRDYLAKVCGILLGDNKDYLVSSRLRGILTELELTSVSQLLPLMERDNRLRERVIDAMTTNETLWFRDAHPFKILEERLLPEITKERNTLDIWCAASSTGQEPYSICMTVEEFKRRNPGKLANAKLVATDISPTAIELARKGEYDQLALGRGMLPDMLKRYFHEIDGGNWKIKDEIAKRVEYKLLNLLNPYSLLGRFDIVFCRNVLIYFSSNVKQDILKRIHGTIKPGGCLFLGSTESLNGLSGYYEMIHCHPGIIYRRIG